MDTNPLPLHSTAQPLSQQEKLEISISVWDGKGFEITDIAMRVIGVTKPELATLIGKIHENPSDLETSKKIVSFIQILAAKHDLDLDNWTSSKGNVEEAKKRILHCYINNKTELNLKGLELTTLPKNFKLLKSLKKVDLSGNPLSRRPVYPGITIKT